MFYVYKHVLYIDTWLLKVLELGVWKSRQKFQATTGLVKGLREVMNKQVRDELRNWNRKWLNPDMFYWDILFQGSFFSASWAVIVSLHVQIAFMSFNKWNFSVVRSISTLGVGNSGTSTCEFYFHELLLPNGPKIYLNVSTFFYQALSWL